MNKSRGQPGIRASEKQGAGPLAAFSMVVAVEWRLLSKCEMFHTKSLCLIFRPWAFI